MIMEKANQKVDRTIGDSFKPPLAIHFVWHFLDRELVLPVIDSVRIHLARDVERPFSRGLNIPLFFYSSESVKSLPENKPQQYAERDVLFVFTSGNTLGRGEWSEYINGFELTDNFHAVPIALDTLGVGHSKSGSLKSLNMLRYYDWELDFRTELATLAIAHEIYRYGLVNIDERSEGSSSSISIFLSHAKAGNIGREHTEAIRKFIYNSNMTSFFDATDIAPGFKFNEEIIKHISKSTLVAVGSDAYSSRYWCQREILCAKEKKRPIVAVDCRSNYEDRIFPAGANVPCVHVAPDTPLSNSDILRVLLATIFETIRYCYVEKVLLFYQSEGWIDKKCGLSSRPPELRQIIELKNKGKNQICYPEPAIHEEEADWLEYFDFEAFTPLWKKADQDILKKVRVGISISDFSADGYVAHHLHADSLEVLAQDLARHLLARSATVVYGGDLRDNGFTRFILDEAMILANRVETGPVHVENHLAWPLYIADLELTSWRAKFSELMDTKKHKVPEDVLDFVDIGVFLPPTSTCNRYVWSRCLTEMREQSIGLSHARVCAGGKRFGYIGKMPGVLEEILIAFEKEKPIYLLGGFGGVVGDFCKSIKERALTDSLTEEWQKLHNGGYNELQEFADKYDRRADYGLICDYVENFDIGEMADRSGLTKSDYFRLMNSPFIDECVHIILKGLKTLF